MKNRIINNNYIKLLGVILLCIISLSSILSIVIYSKNNNRAFIENEIEIFPYTSNNKIDALYLSDIDYIANQSFTRWDRIRYDEVNGGGKITVKIENNAFSFDKGIWAHASSQITYDISEYDYKYFTAFIGLNITAASSSNGVKFSILTSSDGQQWEEKISNNLKKPGENAEFIQVDISDAKYLRLIANDNGSNGSDHSVYANAKLVNEVDESSAFMSVAEFDRIINTQYASQYDITGDFEFTLLKRELIKNVGQYTINSFYNASDDNKKAIDWLMNNQDILRLYILGGKPSGSYYRSLDVLSKLYKEYKEDFNVKDVSKYGNVIGEVYKKMAIALSLTHSADVGLWMQPSEPSNKSDAVVRYAIFKKMYDEGNFVVSSTLDMTPWFETYTVEEMRFIMNNSIDDESILWLNEYTQREIEAGRGTLAPHKYIAYVWPNYSNPIFHDPDKKDYWDEKFGGIFSKYGVSYSTEGKTIYKVWMNFRNEYGTGAVCGGISKTGVNIRGVHGIPATVIGQPGHAAIAYYNRTADGKGYWALDNNVSGWTLSEKGERMLLGWGNDSRYRNSYNVPYIGMAQEALNRFDDYQRSQEFVMIADSYSNNSAKKEEYLWKAIDALYFNVDAWYSLLELYNNDSTKTEEDYINLASKLSENLMKFPLAYYDLMAKLKPKMQSVATQFKYTLLLTDTLNKGKVYNGTDITPSASALTRVMAAYLLGKVDTSLATFSFDGPDAGKIVLASRFDGNGVRWDYSLDGKEGPWHETFFTGEEEHKLQLTPEEIEHITSTNDIYIHIVGVSYSEENLYKIDILESAGMPSTLYANDLENKMMGTTSTLVWKLNASDEWTSFADRLPDLTGEKEIMIKVRATGVRLASTDYVTYHFTPDTDSATRKYIPVSHLSLESVSSEATSQGRYAINIIDGNANTSWHSDWNGGDTTKEIVIKLDEPKNLTSLEYIPLAGGNGKILSAQILVSMDGENWIEVVSSTNWKYANNNDISMKTVDFEPTKGQYIKIVGKSTTTNSSSKSYIGGSMFNFYENTTVKIVGAFSFDGERAGQIVLDTENYNGEPWKYSIDGCKSWKDTIGKKVQLTADEIENINEQDMIRIQLANDPTEYTLTIKKEVAPELAYLNDLENRLIAVTNASKIEWKIKGTTDNWKSYTDEEPIVTGNKILLVRTKAHGILQASDPIEYEFTDDNQPDSMKYIPVKHLSIHEYSTQSVDSKRPFYAPNAIDGNINTLWHTDFRYNVLQQSVKPFIIIQLDTPRYISALEFVQKKYIANDPDFIKNGTVYVSMDGENWTQAGKIENCPQNTELRRIEFDESVYGQYVKLEFDTYNMFASAAMINIFEDTNKNLPNVNLEYDITTKTNNSVTVTLVSDKNITIQNNNGSHTHVFNENGSFVFEYVDASGNEQIITATVDWIDKTAPIGTVSYSTRDVTNQNVIVTLTTNEEATITNNGGSHTYTFTENGEFTFEFVDEAGNIGTTTVAVDWINKNAPIGSITYSIESKTDQEVIATLDVAPGITITNNNGSKSYTFRENGEFIFEFVDSIGNRGTATAIVTWIDKIVAVGTVSYNVNTPTNGSVVAKLNISQNSIILNNDGKDTYTFTENGNFTFEFMDEEGNRGTVTAKVDWIDKIAPIGTVSYSTKEVTNQEVTVTLTTNEEVTITNNNGSNKYTFTENGTFTFEFKDTAGNTGSAIAKVDWIDNEKPTAEIKYSETNPTKNNVVVSLINPSKEITIINNNGKDTYIFKENGEFTFEFVDNLGNKGKATAKVDWIDNEKPTAEIKYSETKTTKNDVVASLINISKEVTITNNNGKATYTFTKNGEFTFEFVDKVGNKGTVTAKVDWIIKDDKKEDPEKNPPANNDTNNKNENGNTNNVNKPSNTIINSNNQSNNKNDSNNNQVDNQPLKPDVNEKNEGSDTNKPVVPDNNQHEVDKSTSSSTQKSTNKVSKNILQFIIIISLMIIVIIISETHIYRKTN